MKGTIVGSYRILDTISVGGMGTVFRAEHTLIGRLAAVKILHPELCANRNIVSRFFNEAKATTSIKHPGIVEVFDFGYMASGHAYLIMEFLEGMPLSRRVRLRGPIPEGEAALLLRSVCIALAAAHDKGVVHRDLKPDNIFVVPDPDSALGERTKILDFGIAKLTDLGLAGGTTKTGAVMGTPTYMSPEQCRGTGDVDHRADLYSLGCIFYELVAGRPPFTNAGAGEAIGSHLFVNPQPPSSFVAGLSRETELLIMKLLAKQPEHRVQSAKELAHVLALIAQQHGWTMPGDLSRPSLSVPAAISSGGFATPAYTPATTPTTLQPTPLTPGVPPQIPTLPTPHHTQKPTTLSGAASEIRDPPRRSRVRIGLAIAGGLLAAAGGIAAAVAFGGSSDAHATRATASPSEPAGRGSVAPAPAPASESVARPAVADPPPVAAEPAPAPPAAPVPPATEPAPQPEPTPGASATPPASTPPAVAPGKPVVVPAPRPPPKPSILKKPARKPDKGSNEDKDLLEQDI